MRRPSAPHWLQSCVFVGLALFQTSAFAYTSALNPLLQYETDPSTAAAPSQPAATPAFVPSPMAEPVLRDESSESRTSEATWAISPYYANGMPI